jgi:hypothetical protein
MTTSTPPKTESGYASDFTGIGTTFVDILETVPSLIWPTSVRTYAQMRTDTQLTSVLAAYTLPLRQAPKYVDPAGCKDEVAQLIADDLGLPILGTDPEPGPARRRGVDFNEHFRMALLDLIFGHMFFEQVYEIRGGKARLIKLAERMPSTVTDILTTDQGDLESVLQFGSKATLSANRLVWYCHEREGAAWQGRSLLRPAYGPWLLKHEMMRVLATSSRRFGMGVPTVKAPPGGTPGQIEEAKRLATSVRVGEQSGAGMPDGFSMELVGITGSTPDTLGYIKYLDNQMAKMALAGALELDSSPNGSRALGEAFVNLLTTCLNGIGQEISGPLTKLSTQMVDYNWGEDEPAPRIVIGDVNSKPEITAEAIQLLMNCGAITADPELDSWVRERYGLPERDPNAPKPGMPLDLGPQKAPGATETGAPSELTPGDGPEPGSSSAAKLKPRSRRIRTEKGKAEAASTYRNLTEIEAASGMDPELIQADWESTLDTLARKWQREEEKAREDLLEQVSAAVDAKDPVRLGGLTLDSSKAAELLAEMMEKLAMESADRAVEEAESQGVTIPPPTLDLTAFPELATAVALIVAAGTAAAAGREALRVWGSDTDGEAVASKVNDHLNGFTDAWLKEQLGGALSTAQNQGRLAIMAGQPKATLYASEVLDKNTCDNCMDIDGTKFETDEQAQEAYASGGYVDCLGRLRCRGIVVAVWDS